MKCSCGCNQETPVATKTDARRGIVKGQPMKFLPGHNSVSAKKGVILLPSSANKITLETTNSAASYTVERTAPEAVEITATDIERYGKTDKQDAAHAYTMRMNYLDAQDKRTFVERGLIVKAVDEGELWRRVIDNETGEPYRSTAQWIVGECPHSQATCFDAWGAMKRLTDVPAEELRQMPRSNVKQLSKVTSKKAKRDPEIIHAAQTQSENEFIETVNRSYPDQHLEPNAKLIMKPSASARSCLDRVIEAGMMLYEVPTREEALEAVGQSWLDSPCELEKYQSLTNSQAYVALLASGKKGKRA